jgi:predicted AlkP superfamily phosphohydrolase/phosphomutase
VSVEVPFEGVLWVLWDGASYDVVRELLDAGDLPALASLDAGRIARIAPLTPNCQTPPSLASLFTGTTPAEHGVTGFYVPRREPEATFVDRRSGFERAVLRHPLIWERVSAVGTWVGLSHIPWSVPDSSSVIVDGYQRCLSEPDVIELEPGANVEVELGDHRLHVRATRTGCEVGVPGTAEPITLAATGPLRLSPRPLRFGPGQATRLGLTTGTNGRLLLAHIGLWEMRVSPPRLADATDEAVGAFLGKLLGEPYNQGALGLRAMEGGDGSAEGALLESARWQIDCFTRSGESILRMAPRDGLAMIYLPTLDAVQHEVFRWWAEDSRMRDVLRRAYRMADQALAGLLREVGPGCTVVVSSDHGAAALRRHYHVNETLARAGLIRFDEHGKIDVPASRVAFHPAADGSVWVNPTGRPGGLVDAASRDAVVDAAERALHAVRDPATGEPPIDVARTDKAVRDHVGDLFVRMKPGYEPSAERDSHGAEFRDAGKGGTHVTPTGEATLSGILAIRNGGPSLRAERGMTLMDVHAVVFERCATLPEMTSIDRGAR